jgi:uncharacterized protein with HEPN domain
MQPETRKLLADMLDAADAIVEFTAGKSVADLAGNKLLRAGIYYEFVIVGEALSRLRQSDPETAEKISENWRIVGFRNQIIHGYARIDDEITWRIIELKLPILRNELRQLLA